MFPHLEICIGVAVEEQVKLGQEIRLTYPNELAIWLQTHYGHTVRS